MILQFFENIFMGLCVPPVYRFGENIVKMAIVVYTLEVGAYIFHLIHLFGFWGKPKYVFQRETLNRIFARSLSLTFTTVHVSLNETGLVCTASRNF